MEFFGRNEFPAQCHGSASMFAHFRENFCGRKQGSRTHWKSVGRPTKFRLRRHAVQPQRFSRQSSERRAESAIFKKFSACGALWEDSMETGLQHVGSNRRDRNGSPASCHSNVNIFAHFQKKIRLRRSLGRTERG